MGAGTDAAASTNGIGISETEPPSMAADDIDVREPAEPVGTR